MHINWKIRLRNKVWLGSMLAAAVAFVYDVLALVDAIPPVGEDAVLQAISALLTLLTAVGVVIDPTTPGAQDSERAMKYE